MRWAAVLAAVAAIGLCGASQAPQQADTNDKAPAPQERQGATPDQSGSREAPTTVPLPEKKPAPQQQARPAKEESVLGDVKRRLPWWLAMFLESELTNFLVMAFTGVLTVVAIMQNRLERKLAEDTADSLNVARKSADAAAKLAEASHRQVEMAADTALRELRPYVYFTRALGEPTPLKRDDQLTVTLKNFGQTPARGIVVRRGSLFAQRPIGDAEVSLADDQPEIIDLGPGADFALFFATSDLSDAQFKSITEPGPSVLLLRIRAEYEYAPGQTDACDMTMVICEDAIEHKSLNAMSRWERERE